MNGVKLLRTFNVEYILTWYVSVFDNKITVAYSKVIEELLNIVAYISHPNTKVCTITKKERVIGITAHQRHTFFFCMLFKEFVLCFFGK